MNRGRAWTFDVRDELAGNVRYASRANIVKKNFLRSAIAYGLDILDDEEFALLHEENRSKTLEIPYWQYEKFDLDRMNNDECKAEF